MDVSKISAAAIRYGISNRATAAIGTATLAATKDAQMFNTNVIDLPVIDSNKIKHSKFKLLKTTREAASTSLKSSGISCTFLMGEKI